MVTRGKTNSHLLKTHSFIYVWKWYKFYSRLQEQNARIWYTNYNLDNLQHSSSSVTLTCLPLSNCVKPENRLWSRDCLGSAWSKVNNVEKLRIRAGKVGSEMQWTHTDAVAICSHFFLSYFSQIPDRVPTNLSIQNSSTGEVKHSKSAKISAELFIFNTLPTLK